MGKGSKTRRRRLSLQPEVGGTGGLEKLASSSGFSDVTVRPPQGCWGGSGGLGWGSEQGQVNNKGGPPPMYWKLTGCRTSHFCVWLSY